MSGHCYVVLFSNKTAKIGKTKNLVQRIRTHRRDGRKFGVEISSIMFTGKMNNYEDTEVKMLSYWKGGDGEYFPNKRAEDAEKMLDDLNISYTKCNDVKPTGDSTKLSAIIEVGDPKTRAEGDSGKMSERVLRAIAREGGSATLGRVCNRFRREDNKFVAATLSEMVSEGIVVKECKEHPQNATIIERFYLTENL